MTLFKGKIGLLSNLPLEMSITQECASSTGEPNELTANRKGPTSNGCKDSRFHVESKSTQACRKQKELGVCIKDAREIRVIRCWYDRLFPMNEELNTWDGTVAPVISPFQDSSACLGAHYATSQIEVIVYLYS